MRKTGLPRRAVVLVLLPGPDSLLVIGNSLFEGRRAGWITAQSGVKVPPRTPSAPTPRICRSMPSVSSALRKKPDEMAPIVEDLIRLLDGVGESYRHGRHPDARTAKPAAKLLRALAAELEL